MALLSLKMPRLRRYRLFLVVAAFVVLALWRMVQTRQANALDVMDTARTLGDRLRFGLDGSQKQTQSRVAIVDNDPLTMTVADTTRSVKALPVTTSDTGIQDQGHIPIQTPSPTIRFDQSLDEPSLPETTITREAQVETAQETDLHVATPGVQKALTSAAPTSVVHWQRMEERFPVSNIIQLPTGEPVPMPKIQYDFEMEDDVAKSKRESRLDMVKAEFERAWTGYKTFAWLHDELKPINGSFRDPFCGWAATLVDSLDTLWIMGFETEFDAAVAAVAKIDFTTSVRGDIPVFETVIRYLGGLLAAYDVSGQKYGVLVDKAVELGDIIMSIFDTPNRMPILYYRWKPAFASNGHRASTRSSLAELGTLSMEFTRLAQITQEPKYYDAVARITDALAEYQDKTRIPGVFPDTVDASGCNKTQEPAVLSASEGQPAGAPVVLATPRGFQPDMPLNVQEPIKTTKPVKPKKVELEIKPDGKAQFNTVENWSEQVVKREVDVPSNRLTAKGPTVATAVLYPASSKAVSRDSDWDCRPQGLVGNQWAAETYSMGGGQDSTYEYFPKQFLLLGGLEDKYRGMYLKTAAAIKAHMLYRPMAPGNPDILFSGKVRTSGMRNPTQEPTLEMEVTHLTCFIGGMMGMGARIFGLDEDLELAKKLTEGCVWAYNSMPSGVMAETAEVFGCEDSRDCAWNETAYWEALDPQKERRPQMLLDYYENKKKMAAQREVDLRAKEAAQIAKESSWDHESDQEADSLKQVAESVDLTEGMTSEAEALKNAANMRALGHALEDSNAATKNVVDLSQPHQSGSDVSQRTTDTASSGERGSSQSEGESTSVTAKRAVVDMSSPKAEVPKPPTHDFRDDTVRMSKGKLLDPDSKEGKLRQKLQATDHEITDAAARRPGTPTTTGADGKQKLLDEDEDRYRPKTHEEFVKDRIETSRLPAGYLYIQSDQYILRPEAIESVWYMYRITGDKKWQEKGWQMFESIIKITQTPYGHSAVKSITTTNPIQKDEMESFWLAETLKYFYLLYSTPDVISLDEWVLNTEAHPFRRPDAP